MTDDIIRGLALLADEVPPAPVGTVVERARARTRNRRAAGATALAVIVAGTLAVGLGRDDGVRVSDSPTDRAARLTQELAEIRADALPSDWQPLPAGTPGPLDGSLAGGKPLSFACRGSEEDGIPVPVVAVCQAIGQFERGTERLSVAVQVFGADRLPTRAEDDEVVTFADGSEAVTYPTGHMVTVGYTDVLRKGDPAASTQLLSAWRPGGTGILVNVAYTGAEPPLTEEQLLTFATAFTY